MDAPAIRIEVLPGAESMPLRKSKGHRITKFETERTEPDLESLTQPPQASESARSAHHGGDSGPVLWARRPRLPFRGRTDDGEALSMRDVLKFIPLLP